MIVGLPAQTLIISKCNFLIIFLCIINSEVRETVWTLQAWKVSGIAACQWQTNLFPVLVLFLPIALGYFFRNLICVFANHWPQFVKRSAFIFQKKRNTHILCGQNCNSILWSTVYLSVPAATLQSCITNCPCAWLSYCFLRSMSCFLFFLGWGNWWYWWYMKWWYNSRYRL